MHMHIHSMDTLSYLLGDPGIISVRGELLPRNVTVSDNRLDEDPKSSYHIRFANEVEAWSIPAGPRDFEIIGTEGTIRAMNQGTGAIYRKSDTYDVTGTGWFETRLPDYPQQEPTLTCMEDLVESYETGKTPISGKIDVIHNLTEACLAVAESHRNGGSWIDLPMSNRELYVFHV